MTKKGFPGLVLVPPSDRTVVRRRIVRWSLFGLAIVWGISTFLSSLAPPNVSDCQPLDTQSSPSTAPKDCNQATASIPQSQPRIEEIAPITTVPSNVNPTEGQSPLASPSESTNPVNDQTTTHPLSADPPAPQATTEGHTIPAQPDGGLIANRSPNQPTRPNTITDHKTVVQNSSGTASQPIPPVHTTSDRKPTVQPENGSAPTSSSHQPVKSASSAADHKIVTQALREPASIPTPNQPTKTATPAPTDHKTTGHFGNGGTPSQTNTKPISPSVQTTSDRKLTAQPGNGVGQSQPSQPAKSASPADHKQTAQPHNGSVPHQTSPQAVPPKPSSPDRKVSTQLGNGSASHPHSTGNVHVGAAQSSNGASSNQTLLSDSSQDTRLAEEGDAFAQYRLGRFYAQQSGRQTPEAVKWYKRASSGLRRLAEAGNGQAMYILGVMYAYGRGVARNTTEARLWLNQAVERKVSAARPVLASLNRD